MRTQIDTGRGMSDERYRPADIKARSGLAKAGAAGCGNDRSLTIWNIEICRSLDIALTIVIDNGMLWYAITCLPNLRSPSRSRSSRPPAWPCSIACAARGRRCSLPAAACPSRKSTRRRWPPRATAVVGAAVGHAYVYLADGRCGSAARSPLTHEIAIMSRQLAMPHQDPADRFLAATARVLDLTLVTADKRLLDSTEFAVMANR